MADEQDPFIASLSQLFGAAKNHDIAGLVVVAIMHDGRAAGGHIVPSNDLATLAACNASLDTEKIGLMNKIVAITKAHTAPAAHQGPPATKPSIIHPANGNANPPKN